MNRMTAKERTLRARIGAYSLHAQRNPVETTQAARDAARSALDRQLLKEIPPTLPNHERERRLIAARSAHFARLALKAAQARRKKK